MELNLNKPLVFFDLETTGINLGTDRIVEICMLKVYPDNRQECCTERINPEMHIPVEYSRIHGIYDRDVADKPTFAKLAPKINDFMKSCDLAGYNLLKFDIPLLVEEFLRVDFDFDLRNAHIVDVQNIFHKMEPRTLSAAYKFYCHQSLENAHSAEADTVATYEVLKAQLDYYNDPERGKFISKDENGNEEISYPVKNDIKELAVFTGTHNVDLAGHIVFNEKNEEIFNFGKHKGQTVEKVFRKEPNYYDWIMKADFPRFTKKVVERIYMRMLSEKLGS